MSKKVFHKEIIEDLKEFRKNSEVDWNRANNKSAEEWNKINPKTEKQFERFYETSKHYIDSMAAYNATGKKLRLIEKIVKVIADLTDVRTVLDFGCGVGSDTMWLNAIGYKTTGMDLPSIALDFFRFRLKKHKMEDIEIIEVKKGFKIPKVDLILSLDTLEHVHDPFKTVKMLIDAKPKYMLFTTAFGVHETADHTIPMHTDYSVAKWEKYIEENGYMKQKLQVAFPPRLFVRQK